MSQETFQIGDEVRVPSHNGEKGTITQINEEQVNSYGVLFPNQSEPIFYRSQQLRPILPGGKRS